MCILKGLFQTGYSHPKYWQNNKYWPHLEYWQNMKYWTHLEFEEGQICVFPPLQQIEYNLTPVFQISRVNNSLHTYGAPLNVLKYNSCNESLWAVAPWQLLLTRKMCQFEVICWECQGRFKVKMKCSFPILLSVEIFPPRPHSNMSWLAMIECRM